jgi:CRISPR-associated protein Csb3
MSDFILDRAEPDTALSHLALYGLGAILEETGHDVRLSWTTPHRSRPCLTAPGLDAATVGSAVQAHAAHHTSGTSWMSNDANVKGTNRGLMSPRLSALGDDRAAWEQIQRARHDVLDLLTDAWRRLDLRMLAALGEPAYWSCDRKGQLQQDDGASRWEMQPRNQGSEIVSNRLRPLAAAVATREADAITAALAGSATPSQTGKAAARLNDPVGLAVSGQYDTALVWCALWGISQLPIAPRTTNGRTSGTATTSGHIGRSRQEWFYTPMWNQPWRTARLRSVLASAQLRTMACGGLDLQRKTPSVLAVESSSRWLAARGVIGIARFPIQRFGSDNAPERRAMRGDLLPTRG